MIKLRAPLRALTAILGADRGSDPEDPRADAMSAQLGDGNANGHDDPVPGDGAPAAATPQTAA